MVERLWAVVGKPRWSDDRIVNSRIDRLAWMLWLVGLLLWAVATYAALVGPVTVSTPTKPRSFSPASQCPAAAVNRLRL